MNTKTATYSVQPSGNRRAKPGSQGEGDYYRIVVRDKEEFTTFRYHDVGDKGHILRLAGKRSSGSWDTQTWLISKEDAHVSGETLVPDTKDAKELVAIAGQPTRARHRRYFQGQRPGGYPRARQTDCSPATGQVGKYQKGASSPQCKKPK